MSNRFMITRRASNVLLFSTVFVLSACGRDRRHRSRHHLTAETEVTSSSPNGDGEEVTSATELWSEEEFELITPAMPGYVPSQILDVWDISLLTITIRNAPTG